MESDNPRELARTLARAEAAPYLDYPELPRWTSLVFALWFAAVVAVLASADELWGKLALIPLVGVELWFIRWYSRRHGAMPWPSSKGNPPEEIARLHRGYYAAMILTVLIVAATWWFAGRWYAVGATFVLTAAVFWCYDLIFGRTAERVRERLA